MDGWMEGCMDGWMVVGKQTDCNSRERMGHFLGNAGAVKPGDADLWASLPLVPQERARVEGFLPRRTGCPVLESLTFPRVLSLRQTLHLQSRRQPGHL